MQVMNASWSNYYSLLPMKAMYMLVHVLCKEKLVSQAHY